MQNIKYDKQSIMIETSSCNHQLFSELFTTQKIISTWCHRKQSFHHAKLQMVSFPFFVLWMKNTYDKQFKFQLQINKTK